MWKKILNFQEIIIFVEMRCSKLINSSIYMCQSCQVTTLLVSLNYFQNEAHDGITNCYIWD